MPTQGPIPVYHGSRLLGIEIEFDACNAKFNIPARLPEGWERHPDGSIRNGTEIVLNPPLTHEAALPKIQALNVALDQTGTYAGQRGGLHVHVQVADYSIDDCVRLANLYRHFQPAINQLVGKSRVGNTYCPEYREHVTRSTLVRKFNIADPARSRFEARCSRTYSVINFAMVRCVNPQDRTVEFRQGSPSKRADCIAGWTAFVVALTDVATRTTLWDAAMACPPTLQGLKQVMAMAQGLTGNQQLVDWVQWRYDYLHEKPTPELVDEAVRQIGARWHGLFFVSRNLNVNNALAQRILDEGVRCGKLEKSGTRYRGIYSHTAGLELDALVSAMQAQEAQPAPVPA